MARPLVLAAWKPEAPEEAVAAHGALDRVAEVQWAHDLTPALANDVVPRVEVVLVFGWPAWLTDELPRMRRLRFIQRFPAGVEGVPFPALRRLPRRVAVAGGSGWNAASVAEHAWALVLACAKRAARQDAAVRRGEFHQLDWPSLDLQGKTLGVLGYGEIGRRVARLGRAFGMKVVAIRQRRPSRAPVVGDLRALPRVLGESHVVVVCLPLTRATEGVLDASMLERLRMDAVLVNVARGRIIDEDALYHRLALHPEFYAGLDVWWRYPRPGEAFRQARPFHELPNVVLTPHAAATTPGWRVRAVRFGCENARRVLKGAAPKNLVDPRRYS